MCVFAYVYACVCLCILAMCACLVVFVCNKYVTTNYSINFVCVVFVASASRKVEKFIDKEYQNYFMKGMNQLRLDDEYTDVTLSSGDVHIRCHRVVLAVASDYFNAMFRCGLQESMSASVQLTMEPETMVTIIDYIYTGDVELTLDNVECLVKAGDVLQLDTLKTACENFMIKQVGPSNVVGFYKFAALYRLNQLQHKAMDLMKSEFKTVVFGEEFKELSCTELIEWIRQDDVNVVDEDVVIEAVFGWVQHDMTNRKSSLASVMKHVRLPYCTRAYLRHTKDDFELMSPKCSEYLHEALVFQADTVHQHEMSSGRTVPRTSYRIKSCLVVVGGLNDTGEYNHCHYYEEDTNRWRSMTDLPQSVGWFYSVCRIEGGLLLTGGYTEDKTVNQCWFFDVATKTWEAMPPLITARYSHGSVSLGDCVYVVGGNVASDKALSSVECLDVKRRQWSALPDLQQAVRGSMVATYDNKVFVFGGWDAQGKSLCCTQIYDTARGSWSSGSDTPDVCSLGAAVTLNDSIYLVGGNNCTCLKYHPASDTWARLSPPQQQHRCAPAVVWRGSILVAGGVGSNGRSTVIEAYDPLTDTWSVCSIASLNEKLTDHFVFNVDLHDV